MTALSGRTNFQRYGSFSGAGTLLLQVVQMRSQFSALPEPWDMELFHCFGTVLEHSRLEKKQPGSGDFWNHSRCRLCCYVGVKNGFQKNPVKQMLIMCM